MSESVRPFKIGDRIRIQESHTDIGMITGFASDLNGSWGDIWEVRLDKSPKTIFGFLAEEMELYFDDFKVDL
jgi:hypothetical protein